MYSVLAFIFLYFGTMLVLTFALLATGLDLVSSFSAVVGSINNVGPGLGAVGPSTNFSALSDAQTWICTAAMLIGRLEIFSVLVLFTAHFWRKQLASCACSQAADVGLQVRDRAFLLFDDGAHQVADRQHADHALAGRPRAGDGCACRS